MASKTKLRRIHAIPEDAMGEKLLSISEAAEQLGLSIHTVRSWVQKRQIRHYKLGRRVLISPESLELILKETERPCLKDR
jgi:excisionase family DNA binding protein